MLVILILYVVPDIYAVFQVQSKAYSCEIQRKIKGIAVSFAAESLLLWKVANRKHV